MPITLPSDYQQITPLIRTYYGPGGDIFWRRLCEVAQTPYFIDGDDDQRVDTALNCIEDQSRFDAVLVTDFNPVTWEGPELPYALLADRVTFAGRGSDVSLCAVCTLEDYGLTFRVNLNDVWLVEATLRTNANFYELERRAVDGMFPSGPLSHDIRL